MSNSYLQNPHFIPSVLGTLGQFETDEGGDLTDVVCGAGDGGQVDEQGLLVPLTADGAG